MKQGNRQSWPEDSSYRLRRSDGYRRDKSRGRRNQRRWDGEDSRPPSKRRRQVSQARQHGAVLTDQERTGSPISLAVSASARGRRDDRCVRPAVSGQEVLGRMSAGEPKAQSGAKSVDTKKASHDSMQRLIRAGIIHIHRFERNQK